LRDDTVGAGHDDLRRYRGNGVDAFGGTGEKGSHLSRGYWGRVFYVMGGNRGAVVTRGGKFCARKFELPPRMIQCDMCLGEL